MTDKDPRALKACQFCGSPPDSSTLIKENGRVWSGMKWGEPSSVSVQHWCSPTSGQPSRMIERVGRDHESAIAAWNRRAEVAAPMPASLKRIDETHSGMPLSACVAGADHGEEFGLRHRHYKQQMQEECYICTLLRTVQELRAGLVAAPMPSPADAASMGYMGLPLEVREAMEASYLGHQAGTGGNAHALSGRFRKKPVVIEAIQWNGANRQDVADFCGDDVLTPIEDYRPFQVGTLEGQHNASVNDWIIRGVKGEHYPCKPDIFAATYEPVTADTGGQSDDAKDAARYRWLGTRLFGADFAYGEPDPICAIVFEWPKDASISADLGASIDAAMAKERT